MVVAAHRARASSSTGSKWGLLCKCCQRRSLDSVVLLNYNSFWMSDIRFVDQMMPLFTHSQAGHKKVPLPSFITLCCSSDMPNPAGFYFCLPSLCALHGFDAWFTCWLNCCLSRGPSLTSAYAVTHRQNLWSIFLFWSCQLSRSRSIYRSAYSCLSTVLSFDSPGTNSRASWGKKDICHFHIPLSAIKTETSRD